MTDGMHRPEEDEQTSFAGIQSIETGLRLLVALARPGAPHMLKTIAAGAGMPASKAHRYIVSFGRMGFVEQDPSSGRYRLGPAALHIGLAALSGLDVVRLGSAAVTSLREEIDETVALAIWTTNGPTFVRLEEASRPITVNVKAGSIMPLLRSATGRAFAAHLPHAVVTPMIEREMQAEKHVLRPDKVRSKAAVEEILKATRSSGLGRVTGEMLPGVHALSAPVFDHQGAVVACLTSLGSAGAFDSNLGGRVAHALKASARIMSTQLGHGGSVQPNR